MSGLELCRVLDQHPILTTEGFGVTRERRMLPVDRRMAMHLARLAMIDPDQIGAFKAARRWLGQFAKVKDVNRRAGTTHQLRRLAERASGLEIGSGIFIAAAIAEGFRVARRRRGRSGYLNVTLRARHEQCVAISGEDAPR